MRKAAFLPALPLAVALCACGHPASDAECREIADRLMDLTLQEERVTDPQAAAKLRSEGVRVGPDGRSSDLQGCVGRHITDRDMACVRRARATREIIEHCLK